MEFNPQKMTAELLFDGIKASHQERALIKNQSLKTVVDNFEVSVDKIIIHKVLHKLINNALKFAPDKSEILISAVETPDGAFISVSNPGEPLDSKSIDKILKPFSLDEDILHHSTGLGLGLSLCQALLKRHNTQLKFDHIDGRVTIGFQLLRSQ